MEEREPERERALLDGVRVVEFSQLIAAPFCGLSLLDLGAEVIKVESPAGDPVRGFPPPLGDGRSAFFEALNRGKRGVALDLTAPTDRELARNLIESADVVVENLGDAREALGVSYADAAARKPELVWCAITGWGAGAPGRAIDPSLQAATGLISITGEPNGAPVRVPVPVVDLMTGMYAVQSVLTALWGAERGGAGAFLDCAMADAAATLTSLSALLAAGGRLNPRRIGSENHMIVPSALFETGDGDHVVITAVTERHWRGLCEALGHPEWADDPRAADNATRIANRALVNGWIADVIAGASADEWVDRITAHGAICEPVREIEEGWADPRLLARGVVGRLAGEDPDSLPLPLVSLARTQDPTRPLAHAPGLGEHTEEFRRASRSL